MNYVLLSNEQWKNMKKEGKIFAINSILNSWKLNNIKSKYDSQWFLEAVENSIVDGDGMNLGQRMSLLATMGNAFGERDEIIKKLTSQLTKEDIERHKCIQKEVNKFKKERNITGISDLDFMNIIEENAKVFNINKGDMYKSWDKAEKAYWGVEMN